MTPAVAALVTANLDYVRNIARGVARRTGQDIDDLFQDGCIGLIQAAERWNGDGNFRSYAYVRVNGAMVDGMRRMDVVSRRSQHPTDAPYLRPIDYLDRPTVDGGTLGDLIPDPSPPVEDVVCDDQLVDWALARMTDREQAIVVAWLWAGRRLKDIAADMGVTESRVSQIVRYSALRVASEAREAA